MVIVEMTGVNAWDNKARDRLILKKMEGEVYQLLVDKAETVEHHGFDRMVSGLNTHCRVLLRRLINDRVMPSSSHIPATRPR